MKLQLIALTLALTGCANPPATKVFGPLLCINGEQEQLYIKNVDEYTTRGKTLHIKTMDDLNVQYEMKPGDKCGPQLVIQVQNIALLDYRIAMLKSKE